MLNPTAVPVTKGAQMHSPETSSHLAVLGQEQGWQSGNPKNSGSHLITFHNILYLCPLHFLFFILVLTILELLIFAMWTLRELFLSKKKKYDTVASFKVRI